MRAAPVIWTTVAITSEVIKNHKMALGGRNEYRRPSRGIKAERMVYTPAARKTGAVTMKK